MKLKYSPVKIIELIVRYAATEKADLIIIGNKGVGGLRKWFLEVLQNMCSPILLFL